MEQLDGPILEGDGGPHGSGRFEVTLTQDLQMGLRSVWLREKTDLERLGLGRGCVPMFGAKKHAIVLCPQVESAVDPGIEVPDPRNARPGRPAPFLRM